MVRSEVKRTDNLFTTTRQGHIFNLRCEESIRYISSVVLSAPLQTDLGDACSLHAYDYLDPRLMTASWSAITRLAATRERQTVREEVATK